MEIVRLGLDPWESFTARGSLDHSDDPRAGAELRRVGSAQAYWMSLVSRKALRPSTLPSRPRPDCL